MSRCFQALRLCCSVTALSLAMPAYAQTQAKAADTTAPSSPQNPPAISEETQGLQDIVVTAQRRSERQQNVPVAISTVTAAELQVAGSIGTETLNVAVPGLQFGRSTGNGGVPFLRGVGSSLSTAGFEPAVATYVDDVYIGAATGNLMSFNNVDQVEVLKGPQGTLFGRNATGGVVNIRTRHPSHKARLDARIGYGSYDTFSGSLYATGGLSDTVAINFSATGSSQGKGYGRNVNTGGDIYKSKDFGLRSQLLWEPSASTSLLISGDYAEINSDAGLNTTILPGTVGIDGSTFPGWYRSSHSPVDTNKFTQYGVSARLDHDFGGVRLASITAYRYSASQYHADNDGGPANLFRSDSFPSTRTISQELQLLSPTESALKWIGGIFYFNSNAKYAPLLQSGSLAAGGAGIEIRSRQLLQSYAAFGEVNYEFLPKTKLTLGMRYSSDFFKMAATRHTFAGTLLAPGQINQRSDFSKLTYRVVLDHHLTPGIMAFGSYSRGFKSGGYNLSGVTIVVGGVTQPSAPVAPETIDAYEIGLKSELFGRKLRLNTSLFYYDYSNLQVTSVLAGVPQALNAAAARMKGLDVDFTAVPVRYLTINGGFQVLDSKFTSFPVGPVVVSNPASCATLAPTGPLTGGGTTCFADLSGLRTARSPKFTATIAATYRIPTSIGDFALNGSFYHNSGYVWDPDNRLRQPAHELVNATLSWTSSDGKYEASVWAKNLLNTYYYTYMSASTFKLSGSPDMPRTFGVTAGLHF